MKCDSFHLFAKLPPEIRHIIWNHCLPRRVAETENAFFLLDGDDGRQACWPKSTTLQNLKPPVIALVNREARQTALQQGGRLDTDFALTLKSFWVQPRLDVLHLNWTRLSNCWASFASIDAHDPVAEFLYLAHDLRVQPSMVAEVIHHFNLRRLLDGGAASMPPTICLHDKLNYSNYHSIDVHEIVESADMPCTPGIHYRVRAANAISQDVFRPMTDSEFCRREYQDLGPGHRNLSVVMAAISLHITREAAAGSGLFGLWGDAAVQLLDYDDEARLAEYHALFKENALDEHEPTVQTFFELVQSPRFRDAVELWKRHAEWLLLAYAWRRERSVPNPDFFGTSPSSVWVAEPIEGQDIFRMPDHLFNNEHPWVKRARKAAFQLCPKIMLRFCTNQCYIKERLPKDFGQY